MSVSSLDNPSSSVRKNRFKIRQSVSQLCALDKSMPDQYHTPSSKLQATRDLRSTTKKQAHINVLEKTVQQIENIPKRRKIVKAKRALTGINKNTLDEESKLHSSEKTHARRATFKKQKAMDQSTSNEEAENILPQIKSSDSGKRKKKKNMKVKNTDGQLSNDSQTLKCDEDDNIFGREIGTKDDVQELEELREVQQTVFHPEVSAKKSRKSRKSAQIPHFSPKINQKLEFDPDFAEPKLDISKTFFDAGKTNKSRKSQEISEEPMEVQQTIFQPEVSATKSRKSRKISKSSAQIYQFSPKINEESNFSIGQSLEFDPEFAEPKLDISKTLFDAKKTYKSRESQKISEVTTEQELGTKKNVQELEEPREVQQTVFHPEVSAKKSRKSRKSAQIPHFSPKINQKLEFDSDFAEPKLDISKTFFDAEKINKSRKSQEISEELEEPREVQQTIFEPEVSSNKKSRKSRKRTKSSAQISQCSPKINEESNLSNDQKLAFDLECEELKMDISKTLFDDEVTNKSRESQEISELTTKPDLDEISMDQEQDAEIQSDNMLKAGDFPESKTMEIETANFSVIEERRSKEQSLNKSASISKKKGNIINISDAESGDLLASKILETETANFSVKRDSQSKHQSLIKGGSTVKKKSSIIDISDDEYMPEEPPTTAEKASFPMFQKQKSLELEENDNSSMMESTQPRQLTNQESSENSASRPFLNATSFESPSYMRKRWVLPHSNQSMSFSIMRKEPEEADTANDKNSSISCISEDYSLQNNISPSVSMESQIFSTSTGAPDVVPSKRGSTSSSTELVRRRTFELEKSVTDISLLKSVSFRDSDRYEEKSTEADVNDSMFSKVTFRRKLKIGFDTSQESVGFSSVDDSLNSTFSFDKDEDNKECHVKRTSTPKRHSIKINDSILKQVLRKQEKLLNSTQKANSSNSSMSSSKSGRLNKSKKMPDFAAIHKKAAEKMEDIREYQIRKNERAKLLLSGKKPIKSDKSASSKKKVGFSAVGTPKKAFFNVPLPTTPFPRTTIEVNKAEANTPGPKKEQSSPFRFPAKAQEPKVLKIVPTFRFNSKIPVVNAFNWTKKTPNHQKKVEVLQPKDVNIQRPGGCNFAAQKAVDRKNEARAMILSKARVGNRNSGSRKEIIKGVRSNRRFDLLMKMRGNC